MSNAVAYAEGSLRVHETFETAMRLADELESLSSDLTKVKSEIRTAELNRDQAVARISDEVYSSGEDMTATARERVIKTRSVMDAPMRKGHQMLTELLNRRDAIELEMDLVKTRIRVLSSRLDELGGLLNFYAAAKQESLNNPATTGETK